MQGNSKQAYFSVRNLFPIPISIYMIVPKFFVHVIVALR